MIKKQKNFRISPTKHFHKWAQNSFVQLESITHENGDRFYRSPLFGDEEYPSVTTILSKLENKSLNEWRNAVGFKFADSESRRAANRGTRIHALVEGYLLNNVQDMSPFDYELLKQIQPALDRIAYVEHIEETLYSKKLKLAGRVDLICDWDKLWNRTIIDIKTSTNTKYSSDFVIDKYFIQACAYASMYEELTQRTAPNLVLIMAIENSIKCEVFEAKTADYVVKLHKAIDNYREKTACQKSQNILQQQQ